MASVTAVLLLLLAVASQVETGSVEISSQPGVEVRWEGQPVGVTDSGGSLEIGRVPPGVFPLSFHKEGFATRRLEVEVGPGRRRLTVELEPLPRAEDGRETVSPRVPEAAGKGLARPLPRTWMVVLGLLVLLTLLSLILRRRSRRAAARPPAGKRTSGAASRRSSAEVVPGSSHREGFRGRFRPETANDDPEREDDFLRELKRREVAMERLVDVTPDRRRREEEGAEEGES